ncbi:MAG: thiamine pyrophosphate-binding protein [Halodesulfurarchaeum sp.]
MSGRTGADLLVEALQQYGVTHVFGNPGTTELPVVRAIAESDLEYVLGLHEDIAVGMAAGYASTRRYHADGKQKHADGDQNTLPLGVANLHIAPGLAHGLGNIYNASVTGAPLLVTAGNHSRGFRHEEPILSGDLLRMVEQFTKDSAEVLDVDALPTMVRRAVEVALTPPTGPVFLALPLDVAAETTDAKPERLGDIPEPGRGRAGAVDEAVEALVEAENPVLVLGDEVARAGRDAVAAAVSLAEAAGARVHGEILACEVNFPADHQQWVSYIPPDESTARTLLSTDTVVFAGISTNTTLTAHERPLLEAETTTVHLGVDPWEIGKNHPADVAVHGDPGAVMEELADAVDERLGAEEREARLERVAAMKEMAEARMAEAAAADEAESPHASKAELVDAMRAAAPDAYVVDEGVTAKYAMLTRWPFQPQQYVSNKGGGLGYGLPAAVGAAIAEAEREEPRDVIGFVGDGSYLYYPHTLYSAARYGVDLTVVIPDNRNYRILKDNAAALFEEEAHGIPLTGVDFDPPVDIPANAESHGASGRLVEDPAEIEEAIREGVAADEPVVLDVLVHD